VAVEVFRPQSIGRAARTAFVLGLLIVIALIAAVGAVHQFSALVGDNTKDELSRYLDDGDFTPAKPSGAGFTIDFPTPASRLSETVSTGLGTITAPRDDALVDDETTFDVIWFDLPATVTSNGTRALNSFVNLQLSQHHGTKIALEPKATLDRAIYRDFVYTSIDQTGATRYFDERILLKGNRMWFMRVGSRLRRDEAFRKFVASFAFVS
jgi:hypothetical protein